MTQISFSRRDIDAYFRMMKAVPPEYWDKDMTALYVKMKKNLR